MQVKSQVMKIYSLKKVIPAKYIKNNKHTKNIGKPGIILCWQIPIIPLEEKEKLLMRITVIKRYANVPHLTHLIFTEKQ